jgi:KDO2-lipid IV(A) palmitoleoyltransferase
MQKRGVMVVGVHFMSLELGGRVMGLCQPMMDLSTAQQSADGVGANAWPHAFQ